MMQLPHLTFLRSFEAAARHLSFTSAAKELNCTQAAVSNHVRSLEDFIGRPLFVRHPRSLTLTEVGEAYLVPVRRALQQIDLATHSLISQTHKREVVVSCPISLAGHWLPQVISGFVEAHPEVGITLHGTVWSDVEPDVSDVSIIVSHVEDIDEGATELCRDRLTMVCAPGYAVGGKKLRRPDQLASARLIHVLGRPAYWEHFSAHFGLDSLDLKGGLRTNVSALALEMARSGLGCALLPHWLVAAGLADGSLIAPIATDLESPWAYYVTTPDRDHRAPVRQFREWLLAATAAMVAISS